MCSIRSSINKQIFIPYITSVLFFSFKSSTFLMMFIIDIYFTFSISLSTFYSLFFFFFRFRNLLFWLKHLLKIVTLKNFVASTLESNNTNAASPRRVPTSQAKQRCLLQSWKCFTYFVIESNCLYAGPAVGTDSI